MAGMSEAVLTENPVEERDKRNQFHELSVRQAKTMLENRLEAVLATRDHQAFIITGELRNISNAKRYNNRVYGVRLHDKEDVIDLEMTASDIESYTDGDVVMVYGLPVLNAFKWSVQPRIQVVKMKRGTSEQVEEQKQANIAGLELIKKYRTAYNEFPSTLPVRIAVMYSRSSEAKVFHDFINSLGQLPHVEVAEVRVAFNNMEEVVGMLDGLSLNELDILVMIRGGGGEDEFAVFNQEAVLAALSRIKAYRVVGLGHSANKTFADYICEYSASTPTNAGEHIRTRFVEQLTTQSQLIELNKNFEAFNKQKIEDDKKATQVKTLLDQAEKEKVSLKAEIEKVKVSIDQLQQAKHHAGQRANIGFMIAAVLFIIVLKLWLFH